jgi:hypothetical protein
MFGPMNPPHGVKQGTTRSANETPR